MASDDMHLTPECKSVAQESFELTENCVPTERAIGEQAIFFRQPPGLCSRALQQQLYMYRMESTFLSGLLQSSIRLLQSLAVSMFRLAFVPVEM